MIEIKGIKSHRHLIFKTGFFTAVILLAALVCACSSKTVSDSPATQTRYDLLNTVITISIYDDVNDDVFNEVFDRISGIEKAMSVTLADSEISGAAAMAAKSPVVLSEETYLVVKEAYDITVESGGAFNLAIGPLVKLWGITTASPRVPGRAELEHVKELLDYNAVVLSDTDRSVYLTFEGMSIDLGAIAKGYAGDVAAEVIKSYGVKHAIVDLGGNIITIGGRPDGSAWRIGVRNPIIGESGYIGVISVQDKSVVTSGSYERYFESGGHYYHHIFDEKTGYPADTGLLSVTIISDRSTDADKLSTVVFVLGLRDGLEFLKNYKDAEAIFITNGLEIYMTPGIIDSFAVTDNRFIIASE